jgi:hypothetical protein
MATIQIIYAIGGDETTADDDLTFDIYNYNNFLRSVGSANTDPAVSVATGIAQITIDVEDATTYSLKIREIDEAGNWGVLSDEELITTS